MPECSICLADGEASVAADAVVCLPCATQTLAMEGTVNAIRADPEHPLAPCGSRAPLGYLLLHRPSIASGLLSAYVLAARAEEPELGHLRPAAASLRAAITAGKARWDRLGKVIQKLREDGRACAQELRECARGDLLRANYVLEKRAIKVHLAQHVAEKARLQRRMGNLRALEHVIADTEAIRGERVLALLDAPLLDERLFHRTELAALLSGPDDMPVGTVPVVLACTCGGVVRDGRCLACPREVCMACGEDAGAHACAAADVEAALAALDWTRCPACSMRIVRAAGCNRMFCTRCRTAFSFRKHETGIALPPNTPIDNPEAVAAVPPVLGGELRASLSDPRFGLAKHAHALARHLHRIAPRQRPTPRRVCQSIIASRDVPTDRIWNMRVRRMLFSAAIDDYLRDEFVPLAEELLAFLASDAAPPELPPDLSVRVMAWAAQVARRTRECTSVVASAAETAMAIVHALEFIPFASAAPGPLPPAGANPPEEIGALVLPLFVLP